MPDKNLAPICGLYYGTCEYFEKQQCQGCGNVNGKPFWTTQMKVEVCPLYDCCVNKKQLEHCGLCDELPCQTFTGFYDPSLSEEEAKKAVSARQQELLKRKEIGTEKWLEGKEACKK
ncbi:MAG: DUF3795 domain-containing protein [bacterium]